MIHQSIAHYQITAKLGQGGMGEVYRATDTKLDREVAIKVLPESFAQDCERLARFEREAKALAQLNHPNIASVYGFDKDQSVWFLVMEYVEAEDLSTRLKKGKLPVEETLEVGKQIAEALEAAHEKGIVHRDLKPGNIKISEDGKVKVLDFGLAKAMTGETSIITTNANLADSPTITDAFTQPGTILGTAAYMSPEQARGKQVDQRTDIWAFGCVLYECLTGRKCFAGEDVTETLAGIIKGDPDWDLLPTGTPPGVLFLLKKCLVKHRQSRLHHIADARVDLEQVSKNSPGFYSESNPQHLSGITFRKAALLALLTGILASVLTWSLRPDNRQEVSVSAPKRSELVIDENASLFQKFGNPFALSSDGNLFAFIMVNKQNVTDRQIYIRNLNTGVVNPVLSSGRAVAPFFSPDSSRIGFVQGASMVSYDLNGGQMRKIIPDNLPLWIFKSADWSEDGHIVFAAAYNSPLQIVDENGNNNPRNLTELGPGERHVNPRFLDDGSLVAYCVLTSDGSEEKKRIEAIHTKTGERRQLDVGSCDEVRYVSPGYLLCSEGSDIFAVQFDLNTLQSSGQRKKVLTGVQTAGRALAEFAKDGTLVYLPGYDSEEAKRGLFWLDANGVFESFSHIQGDWDGFSLAPDDRRVALIDQGDIWILDARHGSNHVIRRLTRNPADDTHPLWSLDGKTIYFYSNRETPQGSHGIWKVSVDFTSQPEPELVFASEDLYLLPMSVSSTHLALQRLVDGSGSVDIWTLDLTLEDSKPNPFLAGEYDANDPALSADGRWMAYNSNESGRKSMWIIPMDKSAPSQLLDSRGGWQVIWSPDGSKIFWHTGPTYMYREWSPEGAIGEESRRWWSEQFHVANPTNSANKFEVSQDGKRILLLAVDAQRVEREWLGQSTHNTFRLVTDWIPEVEAIMNSD